MAVTNPSVACVLLANGRPELTARAVKSFLAQTYANRLLLIWDTGSTPLNIRAEKTVYCPVYCPRERSIGELRNDAIGIATNADIILTMDSDDVSHPRRIEEQVALLVASGAEAVGYNEVLFWKEPIAWGLDGPITPGQPESSWKKETPGEAWLYSNPAPNYAIGASLAFWRSTWARRPFPHLPVPGNRQSAGEDAEWLKGVRCAGVKGMHSLADGHCYDPGVVWKSECAECGQPEGHQVHAREPRLICSIHGDNSQAYELALPSPHFKRAAQWDSYAREQMKMEAIR